MSLTAAILVMLQRNDMDTVVLCPQCAIKAFRRELTEKLKIRFNTLTSGKPQIQAGARIHIITHSSLKKRLEYLDKLHESGRKLLLIVDEAQILHDSGNQVYQMLAARRQYFNIVWALTATPLGNSLTGLYWLLYFLNPKIVGTLDSFKQKYYKLAYNKITRWCGKYPHKYKKTFREEVILGYKNLDQLSEILKDYVILKQKPYNLVWHYHKFNINEKEQEQYLIAGQGLKRETSEKNFAVRLHDLQMVIDNLVIPIDKISLQYKIEERLKQENKYSEENVKSILKNMLEKLNQNRQTTIMNSSLSSKEKEYLKVVTEEMKKGHPVLTYLDYSDVLNISILRYMIMCILLLLCTVVYTIFIQKIPYYGIRKFISLWSIGVYYALLCWNTISHIENIRFDWGILLSVFPTLGSSWMVAKGYYNNLLNLRGIENKKIDRAFQGIIFLGNAVNTFAISSMIFSARSSNDANLTFLVNIIVLFLGFIVGPTISGIINKYSYIDTKFIRAESYIGIAQDGFTSLLIIMLAGVIPMYYYRQLSSQDVITQITGFVLGIITIITMIYWPYRYCLENNRNHYKIKCEEYKRLALEYPEYEKILAYQKKSLKEHLTFQNKFSYIAVFPYLFVWDGVQKLLNKYIDKKELFYELAFKGICDEKKD